MKGLLLIAVLLLVTLAHAAPGAYELDFYLTFFGETTDVSANGTGINRAKSASQQSSTLIDNTYGIIYTERQLIGASAVWESTFDRHSEIISEWGNITFGVKSPGSLSHVISFTLLQYSAVYNWHGLIHGAGYYNVTGGSGAFQGADGILSFSSVTNGTDLSYAQRISGSFWVPSAPPH